MKVVVAGGSGLIGRHLVASLLADGHEPIVLSRQPARARRALPGAVTVVGWHPPYSPPPPAALANATAMVNLCGASVGRWPWTEARKQTLRDSRLQPTQTLVRAIADLPAADRPLALINASGSDVYESADSQPVTEDAAPVDTFLARLCLDWEAAARQAQQRLVRVVLLRTSLVLAPGAPALERLVFPFRLLGGGPLGSGEQWISWIAIDDAVGLIRRAIEGWDICGALNVAAPAPVRQREFAVALGRLLRRPSRLRTPAWLLRLLLREQATLTLGSRRVWPAKALAAGYQFRRPDLEKALASVLLVT